MSGIDDGGDGPLHDLVAHVAQELGQVEGARSRARQSPAQEGHVVEHALVPARVLPDHLLRRLRQVGQLQQRHRVPSGCPGRRWRNRGSSPRWPPRSGNPRASLSRSSRTNWLCPRQICERRNMNSKSGRRAGGQARGAGRQAGEPAHAPGLVDQPRDRHADEDRRLLDGAHAPLHGQPLEVGQGERHPLVGEAAAATAPSRRRRATGRRCDREWSRHRSRRPRPGADRSPRPAAPARCSGPEGPVELMGLAARAPAWPAARASSAGTGGNSWRSRRTSSAVGAAMAGCGERSSSSLVTTTTWSLPCG